jgi:hypothetical protein
VLAYWAPGPIVAVSVVMGYEQRPDDVGVQRSGPTSPFPPLGGFLQLTPPTRNVAASARSCRSTTKPDLNARVQTAPDDTKEQP